MKQILFGTRKAFTIVELLIVVVVIAILAAITIVAYNGITGQSKDAVLKTDLTTAAKKVGLIHAELGSYPASAPADMPPGVQYTQRDSGQDFCASISKDGKTLHITQGGAVQEGECPPNPVVNGDFMQTVTASRCPETRTMVVDARDNRTYWIQKMADGKCWMLTSLAYAGGGVNTHGDVKTLQNGTADTTSTFTAPKYYIHAAANPTTNPTQPSTDTAGGGTGAGRQYGYHYNWCAAMGVQAGTSACLEAATPLPNTATSICPAGWRLPIGGSGGEFQALTTAIGATDNAAGSTILRGSSLAQLGGSWSGGFSFQGGRGYYWSASQDSANNARFLYFDSSGVGVPLGSKGIGFSVRCVAS